MRNQPGISSFAPILLMATGFLAGCGGEVPEEEAGATIGPDEGFLAMNAQRQKEEAAGITDYVHSRMMLMMAQLKDGTADIRSTSEVKVSKWGAIAEVVLVMFFIVLIPKLIILDPRTMVIWDLWEPMLSSLLAGVYTYARARDLDMEDPHE